MSIDPVFIFSMPRAGSTLAQRILASNELVSTSAEPWLMLPQLYALREAGAFAEYKHKFSTRAIHDFIELLPRKKDDYDDCLRQFMLELYGKAAKPGAKYFLDKTPPLSFDRRGNNATFPKWKIYFFMAKSTRSCRFHNVNLW